MSKKKKILWIIGIIIVILLAVQVVNAAKYKMVVNVVEGENVLGVNPMTERLDFGDLSRNNGMIRYVSMQNGGSVPIYVIAWKFGNISELIKLDQNYFTLNSEEEVKIAYEIHIPDSAQIQKYSGWTIVFRLPKFW
ncbi:MAG: hypothetical protein ABIJ28_03435 [Patescibacteria group bacterium]